MPWFAASRQGWSNHAFRIGPWLPCRLAQITAHAQNLVAFDLTPQ
jgi:hypothetical protein